MNKWIYLIIFILFFYSQLILGSDRTLQITSTENNVTVPVWVGDHIIIAAIDISARKWLFNNTILAEYISGSWQPIESNISLLINATPSDGPSTSFLTLNRVDRYHTGIYGADEDPGIYSLYMIVHEANLFPAKFVLNDTSNSCNAYLLINDSVDPSDFEVYRMVNSPDLTFIVTSPSNGTSFEIADSRLNITDNSTNTQINIQYTFTYNTFSTIKSDTVLLEKLIDKPNIRTFGTSNNCTILIEHMKNTSVECVRNITYCLNTNDTELECNTSNNFDNLMVEYLWNSTSVDLFIEYDIIYAKYPFNINIKQCSDDMTSSIEPTTLNSSPLQFTTMESHTSENSSMSPSMSSMYLDAVTISSIIASSELPNTTLSPTTNPVDPPKTSEPLAGWKIALIVVGSVIAVILLAGGTGCFFWKKKSMKTFSSGTFRSTTIKPTEPDVPLEVLPSSHEHVIGKVIPQPESTDRRRPSPPRTLSTSPQLTDQQQRRYERRHPQSSSRDQTIRPTIPQPTFTSYDLTNRQEARHNRRQAHSPNYELFPQSSASQPVSTSPDPIHQYQVPRGRRRPLPPISND